MSDPLHPKTAAEAAEAFMRNVPTDDPKMPEPVALMDAAELRELTACNSMRVQCGNPPVYDEITAKAEGLVPVITTEAAQAYAEALAAARVAQERERCVAWIEARKDAFCAAHGYIDPDTGFLEFGRGDHAQAKHEYVSELEEIADGLRALSTQPPETGKEE